MRDPIKRRPQPLDEKFHRKLVSQTIIVKMCIKFDLHVLLNRFRLVSINSN